MFRSSESATSAGNTTVVMSQLPPTFIYSEGHCLSSEGEAVKWNFWFITRQSLLLWHSSSCGNTAFCFQWVNASYWYGWDCELFIRILTIKFLGFVYLHLFWRLLDVSWSVTYLFFWFCAILLLTGRMRHCSWYPLCPDHIFWTGLSDLIRHIEVATSKDSFCGQQQTVCWLLLISENFSSMAE